ncbi:hypothetical protein [Phascolarctobacterium succinatutens]|uniref:hypothetical protein n=1 Tax=Phascolarctobacterium succinatutens TaxID=626940 RepID=UPI0026F1D0F8|nr:hypothetical protein [Phascolarctobacterium succinatutens]
MKKQLILFIIAVLALVTFITGCSSSSKTTADKFVGTYYAPPSPNNYKPVEEITITKDGNKYFIEGKQWEYQLEKSEGENYTIAPVFSPIEKVPVEVTENNVIVPTLFGGKITLTLKDGNLIGTNIGRETYKATYSKSKDGFKQYMEKAAEGCKKYYTNWNKNVIINNTKLNEALK